MADESSSSQESQESVLESVESYQTWYRKTTTDNAPTSTSVGLFQLERVHQFHSSIHRSLKVQSDPDYVFRYLSGSGLRSPRCRYDGVACIVLRYFRSAAGRPGLYLVRTARPHACRVDDDPAGTRRRFVRLYLVRDLRDSRQSTIFNWILKEDEPGAAIVHFETYAPTNDVSPSDHVTTDASLRYAVITGPPCISVTSSGDNENDERIMPTTCLVDLDRQTIELLELNPTPETARRAWPVVMAIDPRKSRGHIAAAIYSHQPYTYLPRQADVFGTTSVTLVDLESRRTTRRISSISGRTIRTCRLQYVSDGSHILIMTSSSSSDDITSGVSAGCCAVLLSADNLLPLYILPLYNTCQRTSSALDWPPLSSRFEMAVLLSDDFRKLVLVCIDAVRTQRDDVTRNADCSRPRHVSNCIVGNNKRTGSNDGDYQVTYSSHDMCMHCSPLVATVFQVPARRLSALSLSRLCTSVIVKLVPCERLGELPVPAVLLQAALQL